MTSRWPVPAAAVLVIAAALAAGFYVAGSPTEARERRLDQQRIEDLRDIARAIDAYHHDHPGAIPPNLDTVPSPSGNAVATRDPVTREPYEYQPSGDGRYQLCARFARVYDGDRDADFWRHPAGRSCFAFTARDTR